MKIIYLIVIVFLMVPAVVAQEDSDSPTGYIVYAKENDVDSEVSYTNLYLLDLSTGEELQLTDTTEEFNERPNWSPDGELIIFDSSAGSGLNLFTIKPDGTEMEQFTEEFDAMIDAAWSPDGEHIAYVSRAGGWWSLFVMDSDTSNQTQIISREEFPSDADWDPLSLVLILTLREPASGPSNIIFADLEDGRLFNISQQAGIDGEYSFNPDWSNDGNLIVFSHRTDRDDDLDIYTMTPLGSDLTLLTDNTDSDSYPTWSPDDQWIAFVSDRDGQPDIYIMRADGTDVQRITDTPEAESDLAWQPNTEETD